MKRLHPLVREFLEEFEAQRTSDPTLTQKALTDRALVATNSIANWRRGNDPTVTNLDRAFRVLGYRLTVEPVRPGRRWRARGG